jgi:acyl-CoA synthetase (AMP-forming)/AMP-acid ligase II
MTGRLRIVDQLLSNQDGNLYELLRHWTLFKPEQPYVFNRSGILTYAKVHVGAQRLAQCLRYQIKLQEGSVVAVCTTNSATLVYLIWASLASGVCLAFLPQTSDADLAQSLMSQIGASVLLTDNHTLLENPGFISLEALIQEIENQQAINITDIWATVGVSTPAFIMHTSGTMGDFKWVGITQGQFLRAIQALYQAGGLEHATHQWVYIAPPLTHSYGLSCFLEYTFVGGVVAIASSSNPIGMLGELTSRHLSQHITALEGVPDFYRWLSKFTSRIKLPKLRHIGFGGGIPDFAALDALLDTSAQVSCSIRYGLTETPSVVAHKRFRYPCSNSQISSGPVLPIYDLLIVNESGQSLVEEQEGEICIRGSCLAWPYLGDSGPDPGYFATGDMGYLNAEQELMITGRKSLFIKHKGFRISPEHIESIMIQIRNVIDCRVLLKNSVLTAEVIRRDDTLSPETILNFMTLKLPPYAVPEIICFVEQLPRTASGKLQRY